MKIPPLRHPERYAGLYLLELGDRVCVGYTAEEVALLLASDRCRSAAAYQIHRVDDAGHVELAGVSANDVARRDVLIFAFDSPDAAREAFSRLRRLAADSPAPCPCSMELADFDEVDPPHVICLTFMQAASGHLSAWLGRIGFDAGDRVFGGPRLLAEYQAVSPSPIAQCLLATAIDHQPRGLDELLAALDQPIQR